MKYEVIGWVSCTDSHFPFHSPVTPSAELAVKKVLQERGFLFGGDAHEDYCPVLNDGTLVSLSWRGWGGLLARARGEREPYGYMRYYMNEMIAPAFRKYPSVDDYPDFSRIADRLTLSEKFCMHLSDAMFAAMASGKKKVELRLLDEKRERIDIGDYIEFCGKDGKLLKKVVEIFAAPDFSELFEQLTATLRGKFTAEDLGSPAGTDAAALAEAMAAFYTPEEVKEKGAVAFVLGEAVPMYSATFFVWTDERFDRVENNRSPEEILALPLFTDYAAVEEGLQGMPFEKFGGGYCYRAEGADRGEVIDAVLKAVAGKEEHLHALAEELGLSLSFEVTALFPASSAELALDKETEERLEKAGIEVCLHPISLA